MLAITVPESRSIVSPPSKPWSASQILPLESVNGVDKPALMRKLEFVDAVAEDNVGAVTSVTCLEVDEMF